jgi:hypothetical protein
MAVSAATHEARETQMAAKRAAANKQDKQHPFLIHLDDASLLPNVPKLRNHARLRVFTGDPKAQLEERQRWIASVGLRMPRSVVLADEEPFDIGKANEQELREVAFTDSGFDAPASISLEGLRKQVNALAKKAGATVTA